MNTKWSDSETVEIIRVNDGVMLDAAYAEFWIDTDEGLWGAILTPAVQGSFRGDWLLLGQVDLHLPIEDVTCRVALPHVAIRAGEMPTSVDVLGTGPPPPI